MNASKDRVMYYHADASPLGGYVTHPFEALVPTLASVSLSPAGGKGSAHVPDFAITGLVRTGAAYSEVSGAVQKLNGNWTTSITAVVEKLNILEIVTADRIVSKLTIEHPRDGRHPKCSFVGSQFEGLRIGGRAIHPKLDLGLLTTQPPPADGRFAHEAVQSGQQPGVVDIDAACREDEFPGKPWTDVAGFVHKAVGQTHRITGAKGAPDWLKDRFDWMKSPETRTRNGYVVCSLVHDVPEAEEECSFGHVIHVPGFGNVFLAELLVSASSFRLTMLRTEMGCAADGNLSFAASGGNGRTMP